MSTSWNLWRKGHRQGLDKAKPTWARKKILQLAFRPGPKQPKPTCIFRGQGKRITEIEKASWDTRAHVMFQQKAWADREFSNNWLDQVMLTDIRENTEPGEESVLFCDNLDAQIQPAFLERLWSVNCFQFLLPPQCIDSTQPVDGGLGRQVKFEVGYKLEEWLEGDENLDL